MDIRGREAAFDEFATGGRSRFAQKICDRHFGVGADGLVIVENSSLADVKWDFYNSDGSVAEMCGNAARCIGRWAQLHLKMDSVALQTAAGKVMINASANELFSVQMTPIQDFRFNQSFEYKSQHLQYTFVDTGVPHAVVKLNSLSQIREELDWIRKLRTSPDVGPRGANVTLLRALSESEIQAVTFERGVEDFTLSCGTGAVAAAFAYYKEVKRGEIQVQVPGGRLTVKFLPQGPLLIGPAIKIAECTLSS